VRTAVICLAGFMIIFSMGFLTDLRIRRTADTADGMVRLKQELPPAQRLASLGHVDALFAYYYGQFIEPLPWPTTEDDLPAGAYFCFDSPGSDRPRLPFAWREIGAISMDRNIGFPPERVVVVGYRVAATSVVQRSSTDRLRP
jgi:hypothetical protein